MVERSFRRPGLRRRGEAESHPTIVPDPRSRARRRALPPEWRRHPPSALSRAPRPGGTRHAGRMHEPGWWSYTLPGRVTLEIRYRISRRVTPTVPQLDRVTTEPGAAAHAHADRGEGEPAGCWSRRTPGFRPRGRADRHGGRGRAEQAHGGGGQRRARPSGRGGRAPLRGLGSLGRRGRLRRVAVPSRSHRPGGRPAVDRAAALASRAGPQSPRHAAPRRRAARSRRIVTLRGAGRPARRGHGRAGAGRQEEAAPGARAARRHRAGGRAGGVLPAGGQGTGTRGRGRARSAAAGSGRRSRSIRTISVTRNTSVRADRRDRGMNIEIEALRAIVADKGISIETVISAIESALLTAYRHTEGHQPHAQ